MDNPNSGDEWLKSDLVKPFVGALALFLVALARKLRLRPPDKPTNGNGNGLAREFIQEGLEASKESRESAVEERDKALAREDKLREQRDKAQSTILERDGEIIRLNQEIVDLKRRILDMDMELHQRDGQEPKV